MLLSMARHPEERPEQGNQESNSKQVHKVLGNLDYHSMAFLFLLYELVLQQGVFTKTDSFWTELGGAEPQIQAFPVLDSMGKFLDLPI